MSSVAEEGAAAVEMTPTSDMADDGGFVRAGVISALAESSMAGCVRQGMIFDLKLSFVSTAMAGETLRAAALIIHAGRRTVVTECRIEGPDGRLVATASGTFAITRNKE